LCTGKNGLYFEVGKNGLEKEVHLQNLICNIVFALFSHFLAVPMAQHRQQGKVTPQFWLIEVGQMSVVSLAWIITETSGVSGAEPSH